MKTKNLKLKYIPILLLSISVFSIAPLLHADSLEQGVDMLLLWDTSDSTFIPSAQELSSFMGTLKSSDRLAIISLNNPIKPILPFRSFSDGGTKTIAYQVAGALIPQQEPPKLTEGIQAAVDLFNRSPKENKLKTIIVIIPKSSANKDTDSTPLDTSSKTDTTQQGPIESILEQLIIDETLVFSIAAEDKDTADLKRLTDTTGGKFIGVPSKSSLLSALALVYDSVQLRQVELGRVQTKEETTDVDYRYLDEKVATPDEAVISDTVPTKQAITLSVHPITITLIMLLILLTGVLLWFGYIIIRKLVALEKLNPANKLGKKEVKKNQSPSFSKLTLGLSRFRNSLSDTESKLTQLSLDLEDYGVETWDLERKLMDAYAQLASSFFLVVDHVEIKRDEHKSETDMWLVNKTKQIIEDCHMEVISPKKGERFHSKFHSPAQDRYDESDAGTVLEVIRKGYAKKQGFTGKDAFVLRQAEVVVSKGPKPDVPKE